MEAETWKVYLTNNIVSFEVHPDELLLDLVYVPGYKAIQESINYKHSHHMAKGEVILKGGWCPNLIPVHTSF